MYCGAIFCRRHRRTQWRKPMVRIRVKVIVRFGVRVRISTVPYKVRTAISRNIRAFCCHLKVLF